MILDKKIPLGSYYNVEIRSYYVLQCNILRGTYTYTSKTIMLLLLHFPSLSLLEHIGFSGFVTAYYMACLCVTEIQHLH